MSVAWPFRNAVTRLSSLRIGKREAAVVALLAIALPLVAGYVTLSRQIEARLADGSVGAGVQLYSAPRVLEIGDGATIQFIVAQLKHAGYNQESHNKAGSFS